MKTENCNYRSSNNFDNFSKAAAENYVFQFTKSYRASLCPTCLCCRTVQVGIRKMKQQCWYMLAHSQDFTDVPHRLKPWGCGVSFSSPEAFFQAGVHEVNTCCIPGNLSRQIHSKSTGRKHSGIHTAAMERSPKEERQGRNFDRLLCKCWLDGCLLSLHNIWAS